MKSPGGGSGAPPGFGLARLLSHPVCFSFLLAGLTWAAFCPVARYDFINLDDPSYVTANSHVLGGLTWPNVVWAFTAQHAGFWHPLTSLSHMADVQFLGQGAAGPHVVNLWLHVANTVLLFFLLKRTTGAFWRPAFVAALFGWHPLRVESVAWVAERKDVLSGFFFMLTLLAYAAYVRRGEGRGARDEGPKAEGRALKEGRSSKAETRSSGLNVPPFASSTLDPRPSTLSYFVSLAFFALGLMSKPMLVTVPFVLLLLDFWPLRRVTGDGWHVTRESSGKPEPGNWRRLVLEKIPFFVLTLCCCVITFRMQRSVGAVQALSDCSVGVRVENALVSYVRYLGKTFWPVGLATPYPDVRPWSLGAFGTAAVLLAGMTMGAVWLRRRLPFVTMGWLWFCGTLIPVIGIVQAGAQSLADRFTYLPLIGVFILISWGSGEIISRWRFRAAACGVAAGLVLLACAARTRDQLRYWKDSESLLGHTLAVSSNNWLADYNLGWHLERQGRLDEALPHYRRAFEVKPRDADVLIGLGNILAKQGQYAEALPCFETALGLKPAMFELHYNLGRALLQLGKVDEALAHYQVLVAHQPEQLNWRQELGIALALKGDLEQAVACFQDVLRHRPDDADAHFNLGEALLLQHKDSEAIPHLAEALRLRPGHAEAKRELQALGVKTP